MSFGVFKTKTMSNGCLGRCGIHRRGKGSENAFIANADSPQREKTLFLGLIVWFFFEMVFSTGGAQQIWIARMGGILGLRALKRVVAGN